MCRGEQPHLNQLAEEFEGRVTFIGVSNNDTVEDGMAYVDEFGVPYAMANAPEVWRLFDDPFRPTTIVMGPDLKITSYIDGPITVEGLRADIEAVLSN